MTMGNVLSTDRMVTMGVAGLGAVAASMMQQQNIAGSADTTDLVLIAGALVVGAMGGTQIRAFAVGVGAVSVGSLISRKLLSS
jgi:hypothetical protein